MQIIGVAAEERAPGSTRDWLEHAHRQLSRLLPRAADPALLTDDLVDDHGQPVDVARHFGHRFANMDSLVGNFGGLMHTAQLASAKPPNADPAPHWRGFRDVWIPVDDGLELSGRLAFALQPNGRRAQADCIVILPGLLGDNHILRTRDLAVALRGHGFHVLCLELRGCGQTEARFPRFTTAWGILETADLLLVAEWLEALPEVRRTGLVGFCWGANLALLTAWADGRSPDHPSITPTVRPLLQRPTSPAAHYSAGVLAFSPVLRFERVLDALEAPRLALQGPFLAALQQVVRDRQVAKGHQPVNGSLRDLIGQETAFYQFDPPVPMNDRLRYLRLMPDGDLPSGDKLDSARIPVVVVLAANDPLIPAQDLADFVALTSNAQVAALVLPGGGHVGFAAYASAYYLSLITNFFSPRGGPGIPSPSDRPVVRSVR